MPWDELTTVDGVTLRGLSRKQAADIIQSKKVGRTGQRLAQWLKNLFI